MSAGTQKETVTGLERLHMQPRLNVTQTAEDIDSHLWAKVKNCTYTKCLQTMAFVPATNLVHAVPCELLHQRRH